MTQLKKILIILITGLITGCSTKAYKIEGTVVGADGSTVPVVAMRLMKQGTQGELILTQDGHYAFDGLSEGLYYLVVCGLHHESIFLPVLLLNPGPFQIDVQLKAAEFNTDSDTLKLVDASTGFDPDIGFIPLPRQPDHTFAASVPAANDTLIYKIVGALSDQRAVAGTQSDTYRKEGTFIESRPGTIASVVFTPEENIRIVFDPDKLPQQGSDMNVSVIPEKSITAQLIEAAVNTKKLSYDISRLRRAGADNHLIETKSRELFDDMKTRAAEGTDPIIRDYLMLNSFSNSQALYDTAYMSVVRRTVRPDSWGWSTVWAQPENLFHLLWNGADSRLKETYAIQAVETHPDPFVQSAFLFYQLQDAYGKDTEKATRLYYELVDNYTDSRVETAKMMFSPDKNILKGKRIPDFSFTLMNSDEQITNESLSDKTVLLDFWATWCAPCKAEMPYLHQVYEKYRNQDFEIVSISIDDNPDVIERYRQSEWSMPWKHVWLGADKRNAIIEQFEVSLIPKYILIKNGMIVGLDDELRDENLEPYVESIL